MNPLLWENYSVSNFFEIITYNIDYYAVITGTFTPDICLFVKTRWLTGNLKIRKK